MIKLSKELHDRIVKRYITEGMGMGRVENQMYMMHGRMQEATSANYGKFSFSKRTFNKLRAYADGKDFSQIRGINSAPKIKPLDPVYSAPKSISNNEKSSSPESHNEQTIIDRIVSLEQLTHTQNETIKLLMKRLEFAEQKNDEFAKKISSFQTTIDVWDKRQTYKNSDWRDLKERLKKLEIKIEPTKFKVK